MILEKDILTLTQWLALNGPLAVALAAILVVLGLLIGFLLAVLRRGPAEALVMVARSVREAVTDLAQFSPRRLMAMTWLAAQEAIRRKILVAFAVFVIILLFAGWFIDRRTSDPAQLYISFVLGTSNFLLLVLGIFISTFSLPNDIKYHTIYTIVTKPVRVWEILVGRILGFTLVGTLLLALMGLFSFVFVVRGLDHDHALQLSESESESPATEAVESGTRSGPSADTAVGGEPTTDGRRTTLSHFHRHNIQRNEDGSLQTDMAMGHQHAILDQNSKLEFGPPVGMLQARVPIAGTLRFKDESGKDALKGVNVGSEWGYRSYVAGGSLAAAIFTFDGITEDRFPREQFPNGLPLEMTIRVFRTYKGIIDQRIKGSITIKNPNPNVADERLRQQSTPFIFEPSEFYPKQEPIPWNLKLQRPDGTTDNGDLRYGSNARIATNTSAWRAMTSTCAPLTVRSS